MLSRSLAWLALAAVVGCEGEGFVESQGAHFSDDAAKEGVVITLPAKLGGGTQTTQLSPSSEPASQHAYGVPSPDDGAEWPGSTPASADLNDEAEALPPAYDLSGWAPQAGNQGQTSSCQSWATGYTAMGWWANFTGLTAAQFAPMYVYSQIVKGNCGKGASTEEPLAIMQSQGIDSFTDYEPNEWNLNCSAQPTAAERTNAGHFEISGYTRADLSKGARSAITTTLTANQPAILSFLVYPEFDNANANNLLVGPPKAGDRLRGAHAVTAFAYDAQGVWILNSWGTGWGSQGWAELSWAFVSGSFNGRANIGDVAAITGVNLDCADYDASCAPWAATNQCSINPSYMLTNCCASCANPAPCVDNASNCNTLSFTFQPFTNTNSCLDVYQDSSADFTQIEEYTCNGGPAQNFGLVDHGDGTVSLRHIDSGKCVDLYRAGTANGTRVELYSCNGTVAQQFQLVVDFAGAVTFWNPHSGKCLDVTGGSPANLTNIQLWDCNGTNAQKWWMTAN
jgi:hypothetical protein